MTLLKALTAKRLTLALLVIPALLGALYYGLLASDRYVSQTVVSVRDASNTSASSSVSSAAAALLGGSNPMSLTDLLYLESYIHSSDMADKMDAKLKLREHYATPVSDPFYRLWSWMSHEQFVDYYRNRIELSHDEFSGLLTMDVQGFEPAFARELSQALVEESEKFINEYAHRIAREKMTFAETEVERSLGRLREAKGRVLTFQTLHKLLDPLAQSTANSSLTAELQASLSRQEAELKAALAYLQDDAYQVRTLRSQIAATRAQLDAERLRATAGTGGDQLASLNIEFQSLLTQAAFAEDVYKASVAAFEQARLDASRKLKTIVVLEPPTLPDRAIYPRRLYNFATVLVLCGILLAIVRLVIATIREHQD